MKYVVRELKLWDGSFNWIIESEDGDELGEFFECNEDTFEKVCAFAESHGYEYKDLIVDWED